ncbi:DUF2147 domain-containing protein [Helicobacter sp. MIT 21-1697]|uniref:DUF2147 domain-containing protein n=1 Tax=Helicobacter sp. MIT 21-1697 TaxID=2993733 RepID=UPI00224B4EC7|nr:DUF2147 domain-containing protein [Helicobacter sp. MIT 21-1697]MCX2717860.1 DUF2147 domain-containing protein [Helicobacter sp. MIT 21-1697]
MYCKMMIIFSLCVAVQGAQLEGYYMTHKGEKGQQGIVEFFKKGNKYYAYGFANVDGAPPKKDIHNENPALRNRLDKGSVFIYNLVRDGKSDVFKNGKVYNFDAGKEYYAKVTLKGDTLELRGSIDKSGFVGETKIWKRLNDEEAKPYLSQKPDFSVVERSLKDIKP